MNEPVISDEQFIRDLYSAVLRRDPGEEELRHWTRVAADGMPDRQIMRRFIESPEGREHLRVRPWYPAGHYHSPVVDPEQARKHVTFDMSLDPRAIAGIELSLERMAAFWQEHFPRVAHWSFPEEAHPAWRYHAANGFYPLGDAITLSMMIAAHRPRRIVEIGSGHSSACTLDALERLELHECHLTMIEPYPERLIALLRADDWNRVSVHEKPVQEVSLEVFRPLRAGDIVFIDSTHVVKAGSDVCFELFDILPALAPGVLIHFHDFQYPFQYPEQWVMEHNFSWNEVYAVRAFLMYNREFEVLFFNSLFAVRETELLRRTCPAFLERCGGSLWLQKTGAA